MSEPTIGRTAYQHTQIGYATLAVLVVIAVIFLVTARSRPSGLLWGWTVLLFIGILFHSLHVTVDDAAIHLRFGIGLVRRTIPLNTITSCKTITYPPLAYGIRWGPKGTLYNVSGRHAVQLSLRNGRILLIGTDDPQGLLVAVQHKLP